MSHKKNRQGPPKANNSFSLPGGNRQPGSQPGQNVGIGKRKTDSASKNHVDNSRRQPAQGQASGAGFPYDTMNNLRQPQRPVSGRATGMGAGAVRRPPVAQPQPQHRNGGGQRPPRPLKAEAEQNRSPQPRTPSVPHPQSTANQAQHTQNNPAVKSPSPSIRPAGKIKRRPSGTIPPPAESLVSPVQNQNNGFVSSPAAMPVQSSDPYPVPGQPVTQDRPLRPQDRTPEALPGNPSFGREETAPHMMNPQIQRQGYGPGVNPGAPMQQPLPPFPQPMQPQSPAYSQPQPFFPAQPLPPSPRNPVRNGPPRPNANEQGRPFPQRPLASDKRKPRRKKKKGAGILNFFCIFFSLVIGVIGGAMVYAGNMYARLGTGIELQDDEFEGIDGTISFEINSSDLEAAGIGEVNTTSSLRSDPMVQNILLLGSDKRGSGNSSYTGWRADTIIILSIDKRHSTLKMTSILRDTYVSIPGHRDDRINAAYAYGGPTLMMKTIESNFGIKIDRYATVSFRIFLEIVDIIGGIDLEITAAEAREINSRAKGHPEVSAGLVHLDGRQTLEYARIRKIDDDFARTSRQRKVLELIISKFKGASLTEIHNVLYETIPLIYTNLSQNEILALVGEVTTILKYPLESTSIPASNTWQDKSIRGMSVLVIDMEANRRVISQFIFEKGISKYYGNTYSGYTYGYGYGNGYGYGYYSTRPREDSAFESEGPRDNSGETLDAATS